VLPFRNLTSGDANLVDAIWDDTRGALAHNPNLRVLGRTTVESLASSHDDAAGFRTKAGAAYLLDGAVQRSGDRVQINLSLVRTADGVEVWSDRLGGPLDDVLAFEDRIASEVEGRIRGRVAPNRGIKAENIATTGEVYAIFAEARAKVRQREGSSISSAIELLRRAVALDPNYAPAWAELGVATRLSWNQSLDQMHVEAAGYERRALALAPNLAAAHAALAMVQDLPPSSEGELRHAVELDPGDAAAWMWLGNMMGAQNRWTLALAAYDRALEVEPLWETLIDNRVAALVALGDQDGLAREMARLQRIGDPNLLAIARWKAADAGHRPAEAAEILLDLRRRAPSERPYVDGPRLRPALIQLGYFDEAEKLAGGPDASSAALRGTPEPPAAIRARLNRPVDFWTATPGLAKIYLRLLPREGRLAELAGYYRSAFKGPDELEAAGTRDMFLALAPNLAADLREDGDEQDAQLILARAEDHFAGLQANGPLSPPDKVVTLSELRAVEGRADEALAALSQAVDGGWLPDRRAFAADLADEPSFAGLRAQPKFQALRKRVLDRLAAERRKLGSVVIQ
jgi:TolB-like protein/tetratricopeptide (TPR) repeat protein